MTSTLNAMDVYFNELIHPYQDSTSMLIKLLDRQSLTEVDHNRGLKQALQLAQECKVHSQLTSQSHGSITQPNHVAWALSLIM